MNTNETRRLMVKLTEGEKLEYGKEQAKLLMEISELEAERRKINSQIKPKDLRVDHLALAIDSGEEEQEVECRWTFEWSEGIKYLRRLDTGEEVEKRRIEDWERQQSMAERG